MPRLRAHLLLLVVALAITCATRGWLVATRWQDVAELGPRGVARLFAIGVRLDLTVLGALTLIPCALLALAPSRLARITRALWYAGAAAVLLVLGGTELVGLQFFSFYDFRPNYLVLEHGDDPEVVATILASYPVVGVALGTLVIAALGLFLVARLGDRGDFVRAHTSLGERALLALLFVATAFAIRGNLDRRAVNPSLAAFSPNRVANEIAGNGTLNVLSEAMQRREGDYGRVAEHVAPLGPDEAVAAVRAHLATTRALHDSSANPILGDVPARVLERPARHVIVVVLESYTARLVGHLDGELSLTPRLDALAEDGVTWTRCYATGERTIQGLEAVLSSFPPLPGVGVVRRPQSRAGFETLGTRLGRDGFDTTFVYGGQGIFDRMRGFFVANGFANFVEERDFEEPRFVGKWGVSDDDLYGRVLDVADARHAAGERFLVAALTVSLHDPWEYPPGRVEPLPDDVDVPAGFEKAELDTFRYADEALGTFVDAARSRPWFDDTLFVFVGDHGVHLRGRMRVPVDEYRVPTVFYAPALLAPARIDRVTSQLDIAPTVVGLLGLDGPTTFFGDDVLARPDDAGFAPMVYQKSVYAAASGEHLVLLDRDGTRAFARSASGFTPVEESAEHARLARLTGGTLRLAESLLDRHAYVVEPTPRSAPPGTPAEAAPESDRSLTPGTPSTLGTR